MVNGGHHEEAIGSVGISGAGFLVGCNTIQGAGKDIERGGKKLQQSAKDAKERM
jgi:predicted small secreted protein